MSSWQPVVKLCLLIKGGNQYNYAVSISDLIKKTTQGKKLAKADSSRCVTDRDYTPVNLLKIAIPPYCSLSYDWSKYIRCFTKGKFSCFVVKCKCVEMSTDDLLQQMFILYCMSKLNLNDRWRQGTGHWTTTSQR